VSLSERAKGGESYGGGDEKLEFIKALLEYVKDDVRQDYLRVTGALAFAAIFVTQVPIAELQRLNRWETFVLFAGLGCLALAAAAYFDYIRRTHLVRRPLTYYLINLDAEGAKQKVDETFKHWKREREFHIGTTLFVLGVAPLSVVLWVLVTGSPNEAG
jgi:hypothetical protein